MLFTHFGPIWYIGLDSERRWRSQRICFCCDFVDFRHFWCFCLKLLFFGNRVFLLILRLVLISATPYYQNARIGRAVGSFKKIRFVAKSFN